MNDSTFANYDNFYSTTIHQAMEVNILAQNIEYVETSPTTHYLNNAPCDMTPFSQTVSVDQRLQQSNSFNFMASTPEEQPEKIDGNSSTARVASSGSLSNMVTSSSTNVFGTIPFVQIHTTNVQPQRTSYGNIFRRNISKQEEIKSEPIKSENAESSKDRNNATPTPPRATSQLQNEALTTSHKQIANIDNNNIDEKSGSNIQIYKCSKCPFLSLRQTDHDDHLASEHRDNGGARIEHRQPIKCLGCSNVFFNPDCLELHLKLDHLMRKDDILKLLSTVYASSTEPINKTVDTGSYEEPIRKSRIYLKNVDCLREPNRQPMEQTDNQLTENNKSLSLEPRKAHPPKQKISIKSVDVLREHALLRKDYEMQRSSLNNFINFSTDLHNNNMELISSPINLNTTNTYDYTQSIDNSINQTNLNNSDSKLVNSSKSHEDMDVAEKPRRPKIYVKSVESFNLMPLDSLHTNNNTTYLNNSSSSSNSQVYDSTVVHLPYMFDSNSAANNLNSSANFISNHADMDTFQFINTSNGTNNYIIDNSLFPSNSEELSESCEQMENITLIPNKTTTTLPGTTDMNLIMNKNAQTTQEHRGTLHLRTVDELNLMNKTEVQHLIAPNLDNNHVAEMVDKANSSCLNDINLIGDDLYEDDHFKFHDLDTQIANEWPDTYEDLAEDINCIIADAPNENNAEILVFAAENNNQKMNSSNFDIDTPQVSLITIRDIEELTGATNHAAIHNVADLQLDSGIEQIQDINNHTAPDTDITTEEALVNQQTNDESVNDSGNLKRELANSTPETNESSTAVTKGTKSNGNKENTNTILSSPSEMPPLVPVTNTTADLSDVNLNTTIINALPISNIPLPPLVPVSGLIKSSNAAIKPASKPTSPLEKGRIYVANNLMEPPKRPIAVSATSGTSVRGRPFGSNRTRITKLKQTIGSSAEDLFSKCSVKGCAFRFKKPETVEYHRRCHDSTSDSPQAMLCPECKSTEFNNWNTLHTHLWRAHQIDMELYKCELCEFKTPIFSRLVNTHAKIHFDDRNYKCEQCEKAFKNSKQLKNHRRWHRVQAEGAGIVNVPKPAVNEIHRCTDCGSTFSQQKTLREHCCKKGESSLKCSVCEKLMSSKSSLKLHLLTHSDAEKRYKCQNCDYATNDHNAFRRHRMGHENRKMYECQFCPYKSVQSVAYQKHVLQKHPEKADSVIHKCSVCLYSTINRALLIVHQAKHLDDNSLPKSTEKSVPLNTTELQKSKIKVKSNLFTTDITENFVTATNNDLNLVQLYNAESSVVKAN